MHEGKLQVGIIGIGWWGLTAHAPRLRARSDVELVAIARRRAEALADAQEVLGGVDAYTDWRELIQRVDLDAVIVATPHHVHTEPVLEALAQGLHVLVEKPMALRSEDAWAMVAAAEEVDRTLMVGYNRRCAAVWRTVADALRSGAIGKVRQLSLSIAYDTQWLWEDGRIPAGMLEMFRRQGVPESFFGEVLVDFWRQLPEKSGGGEFADTGSHFVDLALWLGGAPAVEVVALATSDDLPVETHVGVQARLANDVLVSVSAADGVPAAAHRLIVYGDGGTLTTSWAGWSGHETMVYTSEGTSTLESVADSETTPTDAFIDAIIGNGPNLCTARDGAQAVAFTEAVYRSAAERAFVRIDGP
ncbi:MAG: Gfo/Idh/MocA family oxidoreductase [Anaerolineae bacterium]|nr:Gfo/Idh/MocA family oxidoreductase [Anaerolineae bacterium]